MTVSGTTVAPRDFPTNGGGLCQKGWTSGSLLTSPARLTSPLLRVDGELVPASWDNALDLIARRLTDLAEADAVLLVGANPAETMPPFTQHLQHVPDVGGLVVVDPRRPSGRTCTSRPRRVRISRWRWASCTPSSPMGSSTGPMWTNAPAGSTRCGASSPAGGPSGSNG
jgi:hypothetical protein